MKNNSPKKKRQPVRKTASTNISTTPETKNRLKKIVKNTGLNASSLITIWINNEYEATLDREASRITPRPLESVDSDDPKKAKSSHFGRA